MKNFFSIITFLIISIAFSYGQNINYYGKISDMDSKSTLSGVTVTVLSGGSTVTSTTTSSNGDYTVSFPTGKKYTVKYTKSGMVTKIINLDVIDVNAEEMPAGGKIFPPINLDLFAERPGIDFSFLETQPVVSWTFKNGDMSYNKGQMQQMKTKIEEKLAESANSSKASDAEYNKLISEADALYTSKKYKEALNKYVAALQVPGKQKEAHPNSRLLEIEELLQKQDEKDLAYKQENQVYLNLITAADNLAKAKEYQKALAKYEEAIKVKSDEQYPKDKVAELKEEIANAAKRAEYDKIVKRADGFLKQNSLQAARDAYQQALKILPKEEYPKKQLESMSGALEEQLAVKEQKDKYNAAVKEADDFYTAENYEQAILKYKEALTFESAATYPAGRIKMAQDIIDERVAEAKKIESFNILVAEADAHVTAKEFEKAVAKYTAAIALMEDPAVQTKLEIAKTLLAEQKKNAEQKAQIDALMASAQEKMGAEAYAKAIEDYTSVLALNDKHPEALAGKKKAEGLLAEKQSELEKENQFKELVAAADKAFTAKTWQEAKTKYLAAQVIFSDREHVNNRISEVETKIEQEGVNEQIIALMESAAEKIVNKEYASAISDYDAVLALKADDKKAFEGKQNAEQLLANKESQQQQESAFNEVVKEADKAFDDKNWEIAKEKYTAAKAIFGDRVHVNTRLTEVEAAIKNAQAKEETLAKIQTLIDEAEAAKPENKWIIVIQKYEKALALDTERKDVSDMLAAAKASKLAWEAEQSKEESMAQIQALLDEADALKPDNKWTEVIQKYTAALAIDTERKDVSDLLDAAKESKSAWEAEQAKQESTAQIQTLLEEASALKPENKWNEVIQKYEKALGIGSERKDVSDLLAAAKESKTAWEAQQSKEEQEGEFNAIVAEADKAFDAKNWETARDKYLSAKAIFGDREHVNSRIEDANAELSALQSKEESLAQITALLEEAKALKPDNKWNDVISKYEKALSIDTERKDVSDLLAAAKESKIAWEAQQSKEEQEGEFNAIVAEADKAFDAENWENARDKYLSAKAIFDDRKHVNDRIEAANSAISKLQSKEEGLAQIQTLLEEAAALKPDNKWNDVIAKYEKALAIDSERKDVSDLLAGAKQSKSEYDAAQSQGEQFEELKKSGNELLALEKWKDAKSKYESALEIKADGEISASLKIIEEKLALEAASKNKEEEYNSKMSAGEEFASSEEFQKAISSFNEALAVKENDAIAKSRIKDIQQKLDELALANSKNKKYEEAMLLGNQAIENKDYAAAVKSFDDALLEIPLDVEATRLKKEAKDKINELQAEETKYSAFIESATGKYDDAKIDGNNISKLAEAKAIYESAQNLRPQASLPQNKIVEIDNLLRQIEEEKNSNNQAEIDRKYQDQLELASVAAIDSKYQNAINYLKEAQKIKPEEDFPAKEISKFQAIIDNASAEKELNANYTALISKADLAFDNAEYDNSIAVYNEALILKSAENYPKAQIAKAKEAIKNSEENLVNKEYQNFVDKADAQFLNKEFEKALGSYQSALSVKENDSYASDRADETQQILDNLLKKKRENESQKELFSQYLAEADQLFKGEKYLEARTVYEKALKIDVNDAYTNNQIKLSIEKAREQAAKNKDLRYNQSISSADGFFDRKEYEKATTAYKRALSLRQYEQYPKTKLAEIEAIKNANVKAQGSVEYLGEQSNISIMEGAALLEQGEIERERMKQESVSNRLSKFEGEEENRSMSDYDERLRFENQVISIKDLRDETAIGEREMKREIANKVDGQMYEFEQKYTQMSRFKDGELSRANQDLVFINDDFDQEKADYRAKHKEAIEQIKEVENERSIKDIAESAHHEVKVTSTNQEIEKIVDGFNPITDSQEEYNKVVELQDAAILAEVKVAESSREKDVIQQQLKEDIIVYEAELQRKLSNEAGKVHDQQMLIDSQLKGADDQFVESQIGKDDARLRAVEKLKVMDQEQSNQLFERGEEQINKTQTNIQEVETLNDLLDEKVIQNTKDLTVVANDVKNREETYERGQQQLKNQEVRNHEKTETEILRIENKEAALHEENKESVKENYDELKGQEINRDNASLNIDEQKKKEKLETQKYVDGLENNDIKFNETIANTIGDDYPEGVTQENYVRKDSKGIAVKIVTRRIVVTDGRGEVYIRTQTKSGLTYSKNGSPVTEQTWINGTENANLEKHY